MSGIRFLGLLIEEKPTPLLESLVNAKGDDRKESLRAIYRKAYEAVDFDALERATPGMLREWFGPYSIDGSTLRKAESFFVNALKDAEHPLSNSLRKLARNKAGGGSTSWSTSSRKSRTKESKAEEIKLQDDTTPPPYPNGTSGTQSETNLPVASQSLMLWGLFQSLPVPGTVFDDTDREKWVKAAKAIFEVEYQPAESLIPNAASTTE